MIRMKLALLKRTRYLIKKPHLEFQRRKEMKGLGRPAKRFFESARTFGSPHKVVCMPGLKLLWSRPVSGQWQIREVFRTKMLPVQQGHPLRSCGDEVAAVRSQASDLRGSDSPPAWATTGCSREKCIFLVVRGGLHFLTQPQHAFAVWILFGWIPASVKREFLVHFINCWFCHFCPALGIWFWHTVNFHSQQQWLELHMEQAQLMLLRRKHSGVRGWPVGVNANKYTRNKVPCLYLANVCI